VAASFVNVGGRPDRHRVVLNPDGVDLGGGDNETLYEGGVPVTYLAPFRAGLMGVFAPSGPGGGETCIRFSEDGRQLGEGSVRYAGRSAVCGFIPFRQGVLVAFCGVGGDPDRNSVRFSADGDDIGGGELVYKGPSPVTAMSQFSAGSYPNAVLVGDPSLSSMTCFSPWSCARKAAFSSSKIGCDPGEECLKTEGEQLKQKVMQKFRDIAGRDRTSLGGGGGREREGGRGCTDFGTGGPRGDLGRDRGDRDWGGRAGREPGAGIAR
jgi:hypothetical protein